MKLPKPTNKIVNILMSFLAVFHVPGALGLGHGDSHRDRAFSTSRHLDLQELRTLSTWCRQTSLERRLAQPGATHYHALRISWSAVRMPMPYTSLGSALCMPMPYASLVKCATDDHGLRKSPQSALGMPMLYRGEVCCTCPYPIRKSLTDVGYKCS